MKRRVTEEKDIDITSFMNLMIVLVPVLLMNMVFSQLAVLDLKLPLGDQPGAVNPEDVSLMSYILAIVCQMYWRTPALTSCLHQLSDPCNNSSGSRSKWNPNTYAYTDHHQNPAPPP